jgi:uncharacterized protein (TIGR03437 family)
MLVSAASKSPAGLAPDQIVSVLGIAGLSGDAAASSPLPTSLGGVTVKITDSSGADRPALIYGVFGAANQVNFVIPAGTAPGLAGVAITLPGGGQRRTVVNINAMAPGIFTANMAGEGPFVGQAIYRRPDGSQDLADSCLLDPSSGAIDSKAIHLDTPGEEVYLVLYGTGIRHAGSVTAHVNGVGVPVTYFGEQGTHAGLDQINLGPLPVRLAGAGVVKIGIAGNGQPANTVTAIVQ